MTIAINSARMIYTDIDLKCIDKTSTTLLQNGIKEPHTKKVCGKGKVHMNV